MSEIPWDRVKDILADALDQPRADRDAFVHDRCPDPALLAEVLALLRQYEEEPDFLEKSAHLLNAIDAVVSDDPKLVEALRAIATPSCPFAQLAIDTLRALVSAMDSKEYAAGERMISQGEPGQYLLLILDGTAVANVRDTPPDRAAVGRFGPGDVVGEMSLITDEPRTADVDASSAVRALSLSVDAFHRMSESHPGVRELLTNVVADRLGQAAYDGLGGKDVGGYRIARCVGRGGMGVVYEAVDRDTNQTVALKMMNHRLLYHPGAIARFRREAATLETLDHASIPRLFQVFEAYKTQFLAMQFCEGSTLSELLRSHGAVSESFMRRVIGQLAVALRYVHSRGVVHRDIKPSNVMVARSGSVLLLDFGIVTAERGRMIPSVADGRAADTAVFVGTPSYMAPEQFSPGKSDYRVDYYGLACVAYEGLSGRPAISARDHAAVIRDKLRMIVPPASEIGRGISEEMRDMLARGLDPLPENRTIDLDRLSAWAGPVDVSSM